MNTLCRTQISVLLGLLTALVAISGCKEDSPTQEEVDFANRFYLLALATRSFTLADNGNGTVTWRQQNATNIFSTEITYKKCVQGQVFRTDQNDCRGTGSAADNYGAQTYQYCDANDDSCNVPLPNSTELFISGSGNSEAFNTCNTETIAGLKWQIANVFILFEPGQGYTLEPDLPDGQYWTRWRDSSTQAAFISKAWESGEDFKTARKYVLCGQT